MYHADRDEGKHDFRRETGFGYQKPEGGMRLNCTKRVRKISQDRFVPDQFNPHVNKPLMRRF
jgi:hypothetical protein